jgi:hypothetical protein
MLKQHPTEEHLFSYLMEELSLSEMADIESHLENCPDCQKQMEQLEAWRQIFSNESHYDPEPDSLIRSRNRFEVFMQQRPVKKRKSRFWEKLGLLIPSHIETRQLATAILFMVLGVFAGRTLWPERPAQPAADLLSMLRSAPAGSIQVIPSAVNPGQVEFRFRQLNETAYEGSVHDPQIQTALAYALVNEEKENVRMRTLDLIQPVSQNETVESALLHTLTNDPNPGMRYRAIKLLLQLPLNSKMKELLIRALFQESNPGVRMLVAEKLLNSADPEVRPILEQRAEKDEYIQYVLDAENAREVVSVNRD